MNDADQRRLDELLEQEVHSRADLAELERLRAHLRADLATATEAAGRAKDDHDWYENLVPVLAHEVERPPIEWDEVPRLLHQLQSFVAHGQRPTTHLCGWAERSGYWNGSAERRSPENDDLEGGRMLRDELRAAFDRSTAIWVDKDIMATVVVAAETFPRPWHLEASDLLFADGLAVLEEEFAGDDYHGQNMSLSAISWNQHVGPDGRLGVMCWLHAYTANPPKNYPRLIFGWPRFLVFGEGDDEDGVTRLCAAFLIMLGQPIVESEPRTAITERGKGKKPRLDAITALTLRRVRREPTEPSGAGRDYQHRWIVSAHWRNQWYPSERRHKTILVGPYVKGPDDKPLLTGERVYRFIR